MPETLTFPIETEDLVFNEKEAAISAVIGTADYQTKPVAAKILLSIVIPAYNEEKRIGTTLSQVLEYLDNNAVNAEIVIVDDGSTDKTQEVCFWTLNSRITYRILQNQSNEGKGSAIRKGMLASEGKYVLFMDADMSTPIEELANVLLLMKHGYDVVIGSRKISGASISVHQPKYREFMGKVFSKLSQLMTVRTISDFTCGFKCFRKECINSVFKRQRMNGWGYDSEILFIASMQGLRIKEIPVSWSNSADTKVRLWKDAICSLLDLVRIRLNSFMGFYR